MAENSAGCVALNFVDDIPLLF